MNVTGLARVRAQSPVRQSDADEIRDVLDPWQHEARMREWPCKLKREFVGRLTSWKSSK